MMTPQSKLPTFLKPVRQRPSTFPKERKLKQEKQQVRNLLQIAAVLDACSRHLYTRVTKLRLTDTVNKFGHGKDQLPLRVMLCSKFTRKP